MFSNSLTTEAVAASMFVEAVWSLEIYVCSKEPKARPTFADWALIGAHESGLFEIAYYCSNARPISAGWSPGGARGRIGGWSHQASR